jgi:hypothetical protein
MKDLPPLDKAIGPLGAGLFAAASNMIIVTAD